MKSDIQKYKNYSRNVKSLLGLAGLWPYTHPIPKIILSFISFSTCFILTLSIITFCIQHFTNIMLVTFAITLAVSFSTVFMKVCLFLLHYDDIVYLHETLTSKYKQDLNNDEDRQYLLERIEIFTNFMIPYRTLVGATFVMNCLRPIRIWRKYGKFVRVFPLILPFQYQPGGYIHWILYLMEIIGSISLWSISVGVDCAFGYYIMEIGGELRILANRFRNLRLSPTYKDDLTDCIRRHQMIIHTKNKLENLFGFITVYQAISAGVTLCCLIFQVTETAKIGVDYGYIIHMCCAIIPKLLQIFMYAYFGDLLAEESKACLNSIYEAGWLGSCDTSFKNDILIIMSQKPLTLVAKGCMLVQLDMFVKIVKTSVSYFALLQTLNEANG